MNKRQRKKNAKKYFEKAECWKHDPALFMKNVLGIKPNPVQTQFLNQFKMTQYYGRGIGKPMMVQVALEHLIKWGFRSV